MRRHLYKQKPGRVRGRVWVVADVLVVVAGLAWLVVIVGVAMAAVGWIGGGV